MATIEIPAGVLAHIEQLGRDDRVTGQTLTTSDLWKVAQQLDNELFSGDKDQQAQGRLRAAYRAGRGKPGPLALRVPEAYEYVDRSLATASWWDRYTIHPGLYLIRFNTGGGYPVSLRGNTLADALDYCDELRNHPDPAKRNWLWPSNAEAKLAATLEESYRENRLLSAVSSQTTQPGAESSVYWRPYGYEVKVGVTAFGGEVVELQPCGDCGAEADEECDPDCQGSWDGLVAANAGSAQ